MPFNINAGYGRLIAEAVAAHAPKSGKVYFVATTGVAGWEEFSEMFPTGPEGNTRVWTTLKGLLDADVIEDGGDDVVYVLPNHTEDINVAGAIDTGTDSAGLTVIGLGEADERPLFTFRGATTADINIGSNGVTFENLRFDLTGIDALAAPFDVNDTGFTLRNCDIEVADSTGQATLALLTDANAGGLTIDNCNFHGSENAGTTAAIRLVGGLEHVIKDSRFVGNYQLNVGAIQTTTTAVGLTIKDNIIKNLTASSTAAIALGVDSEVEVVNNRLAVLSGSAPIRIDPGTHTGYTLVGGNYYKATTTVAAGTLL